MIERNLQQQTDLLQENNQLLTQLIKLVSHNGFLAKPAANDPVMTKTEPEGNTAEPKTEEYNFAELRELLIKLGEQKTNAVPRAIMKKHGATRFVEITATNFKPIHTETLAALEAVANG